MRPSVTRQLPGRGGALFRVNDSTFENTRVRTAPAVSATNLHTLLAQAHDAAWPVLVAGPPAVDDEAQNNRTAVVDAAFTDVCARHRVPYVSVLLTLRAHPLWRQQVSDGDGAHPGAAGYQVMTSLVLPTWLTWLTWLTNVRSYSSTPSATPPSGT